MKRTILFSALALSAILSGCGEFSDYDGIGAAEANFKSDMHLGAEEAACTNPHLLFQPDGCYQFCTAVAAPAEAPRLVSSGVYGFFTPAQRGTAPTLTDANECLSQCRVNTRFVAQCQTDGAWHPNETVEHSADGNLTGLATYRVYDSFYDYQRLAEALGAAERQRDGEQQADGVQLEVQAQVQDMPTVLRIDEAMRLATPGAQLWQPAVPVQLAHAIQDTPANTVNRNPAGVQWQQTFDGNVTVDQQVN